MDPTVVAAWIAAGVSVLTLAVTMAVQYRGYRATSRDTAKTLKEQREHLDLTLAKQDAQLDRTLTEQRTRTFNERFATAADRLGRDKPPEVRLAGVYAMAGLADDWEANRQVCVDVLCAYLRMPYEPDPGENSPLPERLSFQASREVRHTVIRVINAHLQDGAATSWQGLNFDFTGVVFDGGDFSDAEFTGGAVSFRGTRFSGGQVTFSGAEFSCKVDFRNAEFSGGAVDFLFAKFSGEIYFAGVKFSGGEVDFGEAEFAGGLILFLGAKFSGGAVTFSGARFSGGRVDFSEAEFSGGTVDFDNAEFSGGKVDFPAQFSGCEVSFYDAEFSAGEVDFTRAEFSGGVVDFTDPGDWSIPPKFPWTGTPPSGVKLPSGAA